MASFLKTIIIEPSEKHTGTVCWLHGLGDSGAGWLFLVEELAPLFPHIKWILPTAPVRKVEANAGALMPAWFDVPGFDKSANLKKTDSKGMVESSNLVNELIQAEIDSGTPSDRIILGGFSQGCAIALLTGYSTHHKLAGVIGCSGWLGVIEGIENIGTETNKKTPFLLCHGDEDVVVKPRYGQATAKYLNKIGFQATFKLYPGLGHAAALPEIEDIASFIKEQLPLRHESKI
ncbi:Phospholipase/carboxylesterase/thioesterase [Zychaea mexicana]|uniref:Phospholipase/carboxylesterase/thioesterase n=1 Tax=Zychaea mexicana TaxID=64656 RepID=UPI0022FE71A0|nr:Phospholipase/carboxylesterase/thioesterase [Zychaea mexicana]KAI9493706.1 Phospholipase/carboxylesterase/thioesterase [Zychaea mexicana]